MNNGEIKLNSKRAVKVFRQKDYKTMHLSISYDVYRVIKYQNHLSQVNLPQYISGQ